MASNVEELLQYFEQKCAKISRILELRGIETGEGTVKLLQSIDKEVTEIEEMLNDFREHLQQQKKLLRKAEALKVVLQAYEQRIERISSNLPQHLPTPSTGPAGAEVKEIVVSEESEKKGKIKSAPKAPVYHKIDYLTTDQFETVPKYLKGRLTYAQVNEAIDQINEVLAAKYKILSSKRLGMGEHVMRKYREFKEQETAETKGFYFFVDKDLKDCPSFKLVKVGQSMLNILRHCGKLREIKLTNT